MPRDCKLNYRRIFCITKAPWGLGSTIFGVIPWQAKQSGMGGRELAQVDDHLGDLTSGFFLISGG